MRDVVLLACFLFCLGLTFRYPFAGILTWAWLSFMAPHQSVYSFGQSIPFNIIISIMAVGALVFKGELIKLPSDIVTAMAMFLVVWTSITTLTAFNFEWSYIYWEITFKTFILFFIIISATTTKARIHSLIWVIVISLGFYGVKGGIFCILHGGNYKVWGPPNTIIYDNNQLALALVLVLPLMNYLRLQSKRRLIRIGLSCAMALQLLAVIGSYSRGSILALAVMLGLLWWSSRNKIALAVLGSVVIGAGLGMMPDGFWERMNSVNEAVAGEDVSFQGRVDAWSVATSYAIDHFPVGAGFYGPQLPGIFHHYLPDHEAHAAHSIYFQVLGEHGFPALLAYLAMLAAGLFNFRYVAREAGAWPGWGWIVDLARMCGVGLLAFYLGAAALSMAYYDVMFTLLALSAVTRKMVDNHKAESARFKEKAT
jgi:probable O-glycosylation ligase (exosortase A-associated)